MRREDSMTLEKDKANSTDEKEQKGSAEDFFVPNDLTGKYKKAVVSIVGLLAESHSYRFPVENPEKKNG